jgi:LysM repeat protein
MFVTYVKLGGGALSLVVVMLLSGCPSVPPVEEQSLKHVEDTVSPGIDTATYHVVQRGETLYSIAQSYGRSHQEIAQWNKISVNDALSPGQRLRIDGPEAGYQPGMSSVPVVTTTPPAPTPLPEVQNAKGTHVVQPGENLYAIARQYGHNFKTMAAWNHIEAPYYLKVGQVLVVSPPPGRELIPTSPQPVQPRRVVTPQPAHKPRVVPTDKGYHVVQPGDTLFGIARHYGLRVGDIALWNGFQPPYPPLSLGQKLRVSPPEGGSVVPTPSSPPPRTVKPSTVKPSTVRPQGDSDYHIVAHGDTLYSLSRHYGLRVGDIALWNGFQPPYPSLSLGQRLRISPPEGGSVVPTPSPSPRTIKPSSNAPQSSNSSPHIVVPGDTLYGIARHYGINFADLVKWNGLQKPYSLSLGQELRVIPPTSIKRKPGLTQESGYLQPVGLRPRYHIVNRGESLEGIAIKYGLSINDLAERNGIGRPYSIYPGLKLSIAPR